MNEIKQQINFAIFQSVMTVEELINNTETDVFDPVTLNGYQRKIDDSHCQGIIDYILENDFFFPSPIICSTREHKKGKLWVVDGQHRIQAFRLLNDENNDTYYSKYKEIKDCSLPIIVLEKPDISTEISTFITINKTGKKVDTSLAYILRNRITNIEDDELKNKIKVDYLIVELAEKINETKDSIWYNQISFEGNPKNEGKLISLNAFVKAERSYINKLIKCNLIDINWNGDKSKIQLSLDQIANLFWFKWNIIQSKWKSLFNEDLDKRAIIQGPIGCSSLNKFIGLVLLDKKEPLSIEEYKGKIDKIFSSLDIPADNWIRGIRYSLYSSEAGYSLVAKELQKNCYIDE